MPCLRLRRSRLDEAGRLFDPQAKAAYRRRLRDLEEDLEEARSWGDPERAARAQEEMDALTEELLREAGLGGRDRAAALAGRAGAGQRHQGHQEGGQDDRQAVPGPRRPPGGLGSDRPVLLLRPTGGGPRLVLLSDSSA